MDIRELTDKLYDLINEAEDLPISSIIVKDDHTLLTEMEDGEKYSIDIEEYYGFI